MTNNSVSHNHAEGLLLIGDILPLAEAESLADELDLASVEGIVSPTRRAERLSWRILLRRYAQRPVEVEYLESGAPQIKNLHYPHISVSHCSDKVAVVLSHRPCCVDIESLNRNFAKLAPRFMSTEELDMACDTTTMAAVWSGKECLYKFYGQQGLDLRRDIHITKVDFEQGFVEGSILSEPTIQLRVALPDDKHIAVYRI